MTLKIFHNELDASDCTERSYTCLLTEWMQVREQYPNARLYKDVICVQNDITPSTKADAWALKGVTGDYQVLCHAGDPVTLGIAAAVLSVGVAVYTYVNMPDVNSPQDTSGSPNNRLAQRQNKHRVGERVPDIYGKVKSIPDLISSVYRYYKDNIQVEECLLSIGTGSFEIDKYKISEGETPISTIEGASISLYEPNQSIVSDDPKIKIGAAFDGLPLVTKQVSSIDGKQVLKSPSGGYGDARGVVFLPPNRVNIRGARFTKEFESGQKISIRNAIFGVAEDRGVSGNTDIDIDAGVLTIASTIGISNAKDYRKLRILSLLVSDEDGGSLNLAGEYPVESIVQSGSAGAYIYEVTLSKGYKDVNPSFYLLTKSTSGVTSGVLTGNSNNIDLSGEYTISSLTDEELTLVNPSSANEDWDRLGEITPQQTNAFLNQKVSFISSKDNFIGWYYAGSKDSTGFILNFLAQNGIRQDELAKQVAILVEYQMVVDNEPTGEVYEHRDVMNGVGSNSNSIGQTIKKELPGAGQFRLRVRRTNDNRDYMGRDGSLVDDVTFESAYSYYETTKTVYEYDTIARLRRMAIGSGTNASELNMIVQRKLETPNGFEATSDFAYIATAMALDPFIGRMSPSEVDSESFYDVSNEIVGYFGTTKAREFNYTFDDKNSSYQEMIFTVAESVFCTARREAGLHFFNFERETANSLALFNHRNIQPESMAVTEFFGIQDNYDGVEFKWRDPDDNYGEAIIKLPDSLRTNYKTIKSQGVTNYVQAYFLANRAWNKLRYNRKAIEATVYGEGDLVTRMDRIAVVDSTVPILCSGQVELQENTILTLDYPAILDEARSYVVHLQLKNGTVDVIDIVGQIGDYQIEVARIPMMPLVTDGVAHAVFNITESTDVEADAYLISEKSATGLFESTISATSYDKRYYKNDSDFINNVIT